MNEKQSKSKWLEYRRQRAWELSQEGWQQHKIAEALGVAEGAVSQWLKKAREKGPEALKANPAPGPTARLSEEQKVKLGQLLEAGAESYGFQGEVWTHERVAWLIKEHFAVQYSSRHAGRILKQMGYSYQKPMQVAQQRNEEAIEEFEREVIPEVKKSPDEKPYDSLSG
jgi:transposase